jgi:hypothetical protein
LFSLLYNRFLKIQFALGKYEILQNTIYIKILMLGILKINMLSNRRYEVHKFYSK